MTLIFLTVGGLIAGLVAVLILGKLAQVLFARSRGSPPPAPQPQAGPGESPAQLMLRAHKVMYAEAEQRAATNKYQQLVTDWSVTIPLLTSPSKPPSDAPPKG